MKVLIYKRTHTGDPCSEGIFGIEGCMGKIRSWNYDAVIGIGGISAWKKYTDIKCWNYDAVIRIGGISAWKEYTDIKYKINWIGLCPKKISPHPNQGINRVVFKHFKLDEGKGENIKDNYPNLFEYMYIRGGKGRYIRQQIFDTSSPSSPKNVLEEVNTILDSIKDSPASKAYNIENINDLETNKGSNSPECNGCYRGKKMDQEAKSGIDYSSASKKSASSCSKK